MTAALAVNPSQIGAAPMRKTLTSLLAVGALAAAGLSASAAVPSNAHAATCAQWRVPSTMEMPQSNGWTLRMSYSFSQGAWHAAAFPRDGYAIHHRSVHFTSWSSNLVAFNIVWTNGSEGVYTGTIRSDGYVSGTSVDRWNRYNRASWSMIGRTSCARWS